MHYYSSIRRQNATCGSHWRPATAALLGRCIFSISKGYARNGHRTMMERERVFPLSHSQSDRCCVRLMRCCLHLVHVWGMLDCVQTTILCVLPPENNRRATLKRKNGAFPWWRTRLLQGSNNKCSMGRVRRSGKNTILHGGREELSDSWRRARRHTTIRLFSGVVLDFWGYSICFLHTQMSSMEEQQEQTKRSIHSVIREISITLDLEVA